MNKKILGSMLLTSLVINFVGLNNTISVKAVEIPNEVKVQEITSQTEEEKEASKQKGEEAESYVNRKKMLRSYDSRKIVSRYGTGVQERWNWCGPATAYNIIQKGNQANSARQLGTPRNSGTPFPGNWTVHLNLNRPGNNYQAMWAHDYTDWRSKLKNCIIYTVDKGHPLVADCHITADKSTQIHKNYSYATNTWHYVAIVGYDDLPNTIPAKVLISDTHPNTKEIPRVYWTTLDKVTKATLERGIIW